MCATNVIYFLGMMVMCPDGSDATCCDVDGDCYDGDDDYCCNGAFYCSNDGESYANSKGGILCPGACKLTCFFHMNFSETCLSRKILNFI